MCKKKNLCKINFKKILKIVLMLLFIFILLWMTSKSFADGDEAIENTPEAQTTVGNLILGLLNGLLGIILWIPGLIAGLIIVIIPYMILSLLFMLIGNVHFFVTPADIFYNRIPILSIDFFDFSTGASDILLLRTAIAKWFVTLTGVSVIALLGVLIYIAIRAVLASTGRSRAKYHKMFVNWLISVGLLGILGTIIVGSITFNNILVRIIEKVTLAAMDGDDFTTVIGKLIGYILAPFNFIRQVSSAIILAIITLQTFKYAFIYIRRMIKIAFLIIISPLITITYSIDKIADNKSQALNTWMHVFIFNVFIQTFHALIFSVFFTMAFKIAVDTGSGGVNLFGSFTSSIPGTIIAIMSLRFIGEGEKIIRQIFNITEGERLPEGNQLVKFALAQKALDFTSKRLKKPEEKQAKSRLFKSSLDKGREQPQVKDSEAAQALPQAAHGAAAAAALAASEAEGAEVGDVSTARIKDAEDVLDQQIKENVEGLEEDPSLLKKLGRGIKTGVRKGVFEPTRNLNTKNLIAASATLGGAIWGVASGDLTSAVTLTGSAFGIGRTLDKGREARATRREQEGKLSKKDRYILNTRNAAKEAVSAYGMNQIINGESIDLHTPEQINQMQSWFRMIQSKSDSGQLLKEYENARKELIRKLRTSRSLTRAQATTLAYRLEEQLLAGNIPTKDSALGTVLDLDEGKNLASTILETKQGRDMIQYNELESDMKGTVYDYQNVQNVLSNPEVIVEISEQIIKTGDLPEQPARQEQPATPEKAEKVKKVDAAEEDKVKKAGIAEMPEKEIKKPSARPITPTDEEVEGLPSKEETITSTPERKERKSIEGPETPQQIDSQIDSSVTQAEKSKEEHYKTLIDQLEDKLSENKKEFERLKQINETLEDKYTQEREKLEKAEKANDKLEQEKLERELSQTEKELLESKNIIENYTIEKESLEEETRKLEQLLDDLSLENEEMKIDEEQTDKKKQAKKAKPKKDDKSGSKGKKDPKK